MVEGFAASLERRFDPGKLALIRERFARPLGAAAGLSLGGRGGARILAEFSHGALARRTPDLPEF
jgi:hypothetical protein